MTKEEFLAQIKEIGTSEDVASIRASLAELSDSVSADYDSLATAQTERATFEKDNETLRAANMKLFLRVGEQKDPDQVKEDQTGTKEDEQKEKLKFEDLFDEKGGLK